jgi:hypothetical protein
MVDAADAISGYVVRGRAAFDADPAIRDAILALRRAVDAALATSR